MRQMEGGGMVTIVCCIGVLCAVWRGDQVLDGLWVGMALGWIPDTMLMLPIAKFAGWV